MPPTTNSLLAAYSVSLNATDSFISVFKISFPSPPCSTALSDEQSPGPKKITPFYDTAQYASLLIHSLFFFFIRQPHSCVISWPLHERTRQTSRQDWGRRLPDTRSLVEVWNTRTPRSSRRGSIQECQMRLESRTFARVAFARAVAAVPIYSIFASFVFSREVKTTW